MKFAPVRVTRIVVSLVTVVLVVLTTVAGAGSATAGASSATNTTRHEHAPARFAGTQDKQDKQFYVSIPTVSPVKGLLRVRISAPGAGRPYTVAMKNQKFKQTKSGQVNERGWVSITFNPPNLGYAKLKVTLPAFGPYQAEKFFTKVSVLTTTVPNPAGVGVSISWGNTNVAVGQVVAVRGRVTAGDVSHVEVLLVQLFAPVNGSSASRVAATTTTAANGEFVITVPTDFPYTATTFVTVDERRNDGKVISGAATYTAR